ncbi:hypothetical protein OKW29_002874 [Paraburkholderia sp. CI3]
MTTPSLSLRNLEEMMAERAQIRALSGKRALSQKAFDATTEQVVQLVIRACGARSPSVEA